MKRIIASFTLSLLVLGGVSACPEMRACDDGSNQKGGKPREGSQACEDRKARMTPSDVALR